MEHILQFGINIDDDKIKTSIEESARREIVEQTIKEVKKSLFNTWGLSYEVESIVRDVLKEHHDEIIEKAADIVAQSIKRSKKYRDALANIIDEVQYDGE